MIVLFSVFLILMALGIPIAFVLLGSSIAYTAVDSTLPFISLVQRIVSGTQSFPLMAVLLFIMMGNLLQRSGISRRIMAFAYDMTAHLTGGLAQVNVVMSTLLAGMTGSACGDAVMQAKMLVPEMEEHGYSKPFAASVTATSSLIAPMIPPGIGLIVYGFVANVSIGDMFVAGIIPGILMMISMMIVVYFISKKRGYGHDADKKSAKEGLLSFIKALPSLMLIVIIMVGIRMGIFTPSEAGAIACVYAFILGLVYRELTLKKVIDCLKDTVVQSAAIMLILAASSAFSYVLIMQQLPQTVAVWLLGITQNANLLLFLMFIFFIIAGMFLEGTSGIMILGPILAPVALQLGINPVHFGIILVFSMQLGGITPPVGAIMYSVCGIINVKISTFTKESLPFYAALFGIAILLIVFPALTLCLI